MRRLLRAVTLAAMVTLFVGMGWSLVSCSGNASEWRPAKTYSLLGKSVAERLETLQTVGVELPIDLFYLGDPYAGMPMTQLIAPTEAGSLPYSLTIMYQPDPAIEVNVILFTTEQFIHADPARDWTPATGLASQKAVRSSTKEAAVLRDTTLSQRGARPPYWCGVNRISASKPSPRPRPNSWRYPQRTSQCVASFLGGPESSPGAGHGSSLSTAIDPLSPSST